MQNSVPKVTVSTPLNTDMAEDLDALCFCVGKNRAHIIRVLIQALISGELTLDAHSTKVVCVHKATE